MLCINLDSTTFSQIPALPCQRPSFFSDDFREVPKVGDDGIIQVRQAGKSWTALWVGEFSEIAVTLLEPVPLKARNPCLVLRGGKKAWRRQVDCQNGTLKRMKAV